MNNIYKSGIYGLLLADALGVPVEFTSRADRRSDPVTGMRGFGTYNQPAGTWSDDSSMTLATLASIKEKGGIDYNDMMDRFVDWYRNGAYTPFDELFDIGNGTATAIRKYESGVAALEAGGREDYNNGNGSLMRILPVCLYLYEHQKKVCTSDDESIYVVHSVSALTHAHLRSMMACGIYYFLVKAVIDKDGSICERLRAGLNNAYGYYRRDARNNHELGHFERMADLAEFGALPEDAIKSSGYVVDTLEAAVWCLLNTDSYEAAVLRAVNLGEDTDTVGAVTGGLAGLFYGYESMPQDWKAALQRREWIDELLA